MKLETKKIREGHHLGEVVWVTSYSRPDIDKRPLRSVSPTKCVICSINETNKKVYYSETYFAPLNKKDELTKKVISPVDNTGFRSYCGNEIDVFTTEDEAIAAWNSQVAAVVNRIREKAQVIVDHLVKEADELEGKYH